jgi:hypothetical protein
MLPQIMLFIAEIKIVPDAIIISQNITHILFLKKKSTDSKIKKNLVIVKLRY